MNPIQKASFCCSLREAPPPGETRAPHAPAVQAGVPFKTRLEGEEEEDEQKEDDDDDAAAAADDDDDDDDDGG
eukprot:5125004-Pyramimonas_sp.AAC.1